MNTFPEGGEARPELLNQEAWHDNLVLQVLDAHYTGSPLSVLFIDLNNFKRVNDAYGHAVGDEVITEIGHVMARAVGNYAVGGRIGGDEFALSGDFDAEQAAEIEQALRDHFQDYLDRPENEHLREVELGAAIGRATLTRDMSKSELLTQADENMYKDKIAQLPALTNEQVEAVSEARILLNAVGLRLRDLGKYDVLFRQIDENS